MTKTSVVSGSFSCALTVIGLILAGCLVYIWIMGNGRVYDWQGKEAETRQNLHAIQLAVEKFAVDTEGIYPEYLIGGTPAQGAGIPNTVAYTSDVLLREGYLTSYPKNPFMRQKNPRSLELQANLPSSITGNDPLRPGDPEGDLLGYRFGKNGDIMGQVLCDPRYEKWTFTDPLSGDSEQRDTWAIIEYPFWDMWEGHHPEPMYLPGMFFYKSMGRMFTSNVDDNSEGSATNQSRYNEHPTLDGDLIGPTQEFDHISQFMLGVYGSIRTKGKDVLGNEPKLVNWKMLNWTRSTYSTTDLGGCPYSYIDDGRAGQKATYGNSNGIRDGIILVVVSSKELIKN